VCRTVGAADRAERSCWRLISASREEKRGRIDMAHLSGHCMCRAVSWTFSGETTRNLVCYCTDCQRATSSPLTAFLGLQSEKLHWSGEIEDFESSPGTYRGFCPSCGTRLYFRSGRWPSETHVHAATLMNPNEYRPDAQVFVGSRAEWLDSLNSLPGHEGFHTKPAKTT
jgi:hypothetical protein